jgi:general secretion pathway protein E
VSQLAGAEFDPSLLAESLVGVVAQRLVRTLCAACREPYAACATTLEPLAAERRLPSAECQGPNELTASPSATPQSAIENRQSAISSVTIYRAIGCPECGGKGYAGRTGVFELLEPDARLRALIGARAPSEAIRQVAIRQGMRPLARHALARVLAGETTAVEVHALLEH